MAFTFFVTALVIAIAAREWSTACNMAKRSEMPNSALIEERPGRFAVPNVARIGL